ncbi:ThiF family adenylyltransferase [Cellulosimicrobium sp. CUA-896]|uniref:ThiF family adenylyltransferase n=1 Tax=Cellulosimicrobium sp. CUA-896 TaxID=1517881 RepID=UPI00095FEE68|nr:ThiF family adenylyltransferase [Cellulosimicrobium sp. CUA-896]OLT53467.1 adenylyltransferase/sulfurtransferase MoeZ [Cellulosimicrobium sp. CUA-896]
MTSGDAPDRTARAAPRLAPLVAPGRELSTAELERYARHLSLPGVGPAGQRRLAAARVLVVGAGGLGSPALLYLAAAGVGTIGVVDDDAVDLSNLQRQVVHGGADVGRRKVDSARDAIADVNPHVHVVRHALRLDAGNALDVLRGYDVVLDGADNFATRYLVSDAAEILGLPVVWGSIYRFQGQVSVFWGRPWFADADGGAADASATDDADDPGAAPRGVTYRDVFPVPPPPGAAPDCATGGVLGAMCGTVGSVMATEAVKLVTGAGTTLFGRLAVYDALDLTWRQLAVRPDPARDPVTELLAGDDAYAAFCGLDPAAAQGAGEHAGDPATSGAPDGSGEVGAREAAGLLAEGGATSAAPYLLDVREDWEAQVRPVPGAALVPSGTFLGGAPGAPDDAARAALTGLPVDRPVLVVCAAGMRSARVADVARAAGVDARSVVGGVPALLAELETAPPAAR